MWRLTCSLYCLAVVRSTFLASTSFEPSVGGLGHRRAVCLAEADFLRALIGFAMHPLSSVIGRSIRVLPRSYRLTSAGEKGFWTNSKVWTADATASFLNANGGEVFLKSRNSFPTASRPPAPTRLIGPRLFTAPWPFSLNLANLLLQREPASGLRQPSASYASEAD